MGQFIYGKHSVLDALKSDLKIKNLYLLKSPNFQINKNINVYIKTKNELDKMIKTNHQGFIAEISEVNYFSLQEILKDKPKIVLILDHIQDPHNLGAIIRTANAAGLKHIILPKERSVKVTPTVLKVAAGGISGLKIIRVGSLTDSLIKLKKGGYWIYATSLENGTDINKVSFNDPAVLVVGNEGKGVSKSILKHSDQNIYIKMKGTIQSLNVSVATGIALFKIIESE